MIVLFPYSLDGAQYAEIHANCISLDYFFYLYKSLDENESTDFLDLNKPVNSVADYVDAAVCLNEVYEFVFLLAKESVIRELDARGLEFLVYNSTSTDTQKFINLRFSQSSAEIKDLVLAEARLDTEYVNVCVPSSKKKNCDKVDNLFSSLQLGYKEKE